MKSPLVVNIRCTCIEEYINIQKLHKEYIRQSKEGEITSIYVGAEFAVPGEFELVDALIAKRGPRQMPYCVNFGGKKIEVADIRNITKKFTEEDFEELKKEVEERAVVTPGLVFDGAKELPQAVDGGVDAIGNPPLPENTPATEPTHFAEEPEVARDIASASAPNNFEPRRVPETLVEPDFTQATPSVLEESDDGWNGEDHNYTC